MGYDVAAVRSHFPALASGAAFFDGPGGSQTPVEVADAIRSTLVSAISNQGTVTAAERTAEDIVTGARAAMADMVNGDPAGIVFGRSMTQLTYDFARTLAKSWGPGDEVVVSRLDHDGNIRPWVQAAQAAGATLRWAEFDPATGELGVDDVAAVLTDRTRLVAVTAASNLIGTRPPIAEIGEAVHRAGAVFYVDGVHYSAHVGVDVAAMGADLFVCSPYKFLGPHCGVLFGRPDLLKDLHPDKLLPATDEVPQRFEFGTLPYELLAGCTAAVDFLAGLGPDSGSDAGPAVGGDRRQRLVASMAAVEEHEDRLRARIEQALPDLPGVTVYSRADRRTPTLLLTFDGRDAAAAYQFLGDRGVNAPSGSFYALEASQRLGLSEEGGLRIGLAPYSDDDDVDRLMAGLREFLAS